MNESVRGLLRYAKWVWLLASLAVIGVLSVRYWHAISSQLSALAWRQLILSVVALILGKIMLSLSARHAARSQGWNLSFTSMLGIVSLSQLAKYIPGGIWHFVGRATLYAAHGHQRQAIARALILENLWQWTAAALLGTLLVAYAYHDVWRIPRWTLVFVAMGCAAIWLGVFRVSWRRWSGRVHSQRHLAWGVLGIQCVAWVLIGVSMWALIPASARPGSLLPVVGAVCLSTVAGFVVPLAPAGIGVREVALIALLSSHLNAEQAAVCAAASRLIWICTEVAMALSLYARVGAKQ